MDTSPARRMAAEETAATEEVKSTPQQAFDVTLSFVHKPSPAPAKGEGVKVMMIFVRSASNREAAALLICCPSPAPRYDPRCRPCSAAAMRAHRPDTRRAPRGRAFTRPFCACSR